MKVVNKLLVDFDGNPIKLGDKDATIAEVLKLAAMSPPEDPNKARSKVDIAERYYMGMRLHRLALEESIDIDIDLLAAILSDMRRMFQTIVSGQVADLLEEKH